MIYECTDCIHCANFQDGYRIFCVYPKLPSEQVCEYQFLGTKDALNCEGFTQAGDLLWFDDPADLDAALATPDDKGEINSYGGCRKWAEANRDT